LKVSPIAYIIHELCGRVKKNLWEILCSMG
jgi:hypothetical protein